MSHTDVSFDPGMSKTGITIWRDGQKVFWKTIRPESVNMTFHEKILNLKKQICSILSEYYPINRIAIEDFQRYHTKHDKEWSDKESMRKCGAVQGMLICLCDEWSNEVLLVSKGKDTKTTTKRAALSLQLVEMKGQHTIDPQTGLRVSEDALDSWWIGRCANFDRKRT